MKSENCEARMGRKECEIMMTACPPYQDTICCVESVVVVFVKPALIESDSICSVAEKALYERKK